MLDETGLFHKRELRCLCWMRERCVSAENGECLCLMSRGVLDREIVNVCVEREKGVGGWKIENDCNG